MVKQLKKPRLLIDTNAFLWLLGHDQPSERTEQVFSEDREYEFLFSFVSAWEIAIKFGIGKLRLPELPEIFVPERLRISKFSVLRIELLHVLRVHSLPMIHKDPFDRLLISQAIVEDIAILTSDRLISRYGVKTLDIKSVI